MYWKFLLAFIAISLTDVNAQKNSVYCNYTISPKILETFLYNPPKHKSPRLKITCRTAFNRDNIDQALEDNNLSEMFDEVELSQFVKYNLRLRWKFKNHNKIFCGAQTMGVSTEVPVRNAYYIGFKKYF